MWAARYACYNRGTLETIRNLWSGRAPGLDSFTAEFYETYVDEISPVLLSVYNEVMEQGTLPPTLNEALISLILKKGKLASDCKSYRPNFPSQKDQKMF